MPTRQEARHGVGRDPSVGYRSLSELLGMPSAWQSSVAAQQLMMELQAAGVPTIQAVEESGLFEAPMMFALMPEPMGASRGAAAVLTADDIARMAPQDVAALAARNRAADPSLSTLSDDLAARATVGLPMDEASRMARADEMFPGQYYHATSGDVGEFELARAGQRFGQPDHRAVFMTPDEANASFWAGTGPGANVMPLRVDTSDIYPMRIDDPYFNSHTMTNELQRAAQNNADVALAPGIVEGMQSPVDQLAVMNPARIRSRFARFDPALRDSANILASAGALLGLGAGVGGMNFGEPTPAGGI